MKQLEHKRNGSVARQRRVKARIHGTAKRPRLSVVISYRHVSVQLINDDEGITLASSTSIGNKSAGANMTVKAAWVGSDIAKKAKQQKIKLAVLDRRHKLYHGKLKALAEAARKEGLEF